MAGILELTRINNQNIVRVVQRPLAANEGASPIDTSQQDNRVLPHPFDANDD